MCLISKDIFSVWEERGSISLIKISTHEKIKSIEISNDNKYFYFTKIYSISKFSNDIVIVFASVPIGWNSNPDNKGEIYTFKNSILMHRLNNEGLVEILKYEYNDNKDICFIGTKFKNNFIATCQKNVLKLIELNFNI